MADTARPLLASCADTVKVWDLPGSKQAIHSFRPHKGPIHCVRWNHNNQVVATCGYDGSIALSLAKGALLCRLDGEEYESLPLNSLAFTSTSRNLACGGDAGEVKVWNLRNKAVDRVYRVRRASCVAARARAGTCTHMLIRAQTHARSPAHARIRARTATLSLPPSSGARRKARGWEPWFLRIRRNGFFLSSHQGRVCALDATDRATLRA